MTALDLMTRASKMLAEAESVDDIREIRDMAEVARQLAKKQRYGLEAQNTAGRIKLDAERKLGDVLADMKRTGQRHPGGNVESHDATQLDDLGVSKSQSSRWQQVAKIPEPVLDDYVDHQNGNGLEVTTAGLLGFQKQQVRKRAQADENAARDIELADMPADAAGERWRMLQGDFRERLADIPTGSVDLIVTDPPYPADSLPLWSELAEHAARVLRPQAILVGLTGQIFLPDVLHRLGEHLQYGWCYVQPLPGANSRIMARHVLQSWKPWVAFSNGSWPSGRVDWHPDLLDPSSRAKDAYRWQQDPNPTRMLIHELCPVDGVVLDPFAGTGSYGLAALAEGRRFIGVEMDADRFTTAVERVS